MHPYFEVLTPRWFKRAFVYTGSIGEFRYRFANDKENNLLHAAVYTHFCYERAEDVQERDFSWDDAGGGDETRSAVYWRGHQFGGDSDDNQASH